MKHSAEYQGKALSWKTVDNIMEVALECAPANEIGAQMLADLEKLEEQLAAEADSIGVVIIYSALPSGFCAGANLRELYTATLQMSAAERVTAVRTFLERVHRVFNALDAAPAVTIAAVHGVCFGGGFELALACDLIVADKTARFCFPELRLGLIPGFGGIPRLKRDAGNAIVRDLLLTGRSIQAVKAQAAGLVSQIVGEGEALAAARSAGRQILKFDRNARVTAKKWIKPIPHEELTQEIDIFCSLFSQPAVLEGLKTFCENTGSFPYLP